MLDISTIKGLKELMRESVLRDKFLLDQIREEARTLKNEVKSIRPRTTSSISIVGTDGGNNSLKFDPYIIHVIRVVDSYNKEYYLDVITPTTPIDHLNNKIIRGGAGFDALKNMMDFLGVRDITQLTPMIKRTPPGEPVKPTWIDVYREIVEWAMLFHIVNDEKRTGDTLIVSDGLLRSKIFSRDLFKTITKGIEEGIERQRKENNRQIHVAGVAKHSKVMERYKLAMHLEGIMTEDYPCYVEIPRALEEKAYVWSEYARDTDEEGKEINKFVAGKMFFVKFGSEPGDPIWPVDIFLPQVKDAQKIIGGLLFDAQNGFPVPFYPLSLQRAHENAALVDLDMDIIQREILDSVRHSLGDESKLVDSFLIKTKDVAANRYSR